MTKPCHRCAGEVNTDFPENVEVRVKDSEPWWFHYGCWHLFCWKVHEGRARDEELWT